MQFCEKCGSLLSPEVEKKKKGKPQVFLVCRNCGTRIPAENAEEYTLEEDVAHSEDEMVEVVEGGMQTVVITEETREVLSEHYREMLEYLDPE